MRPWIPKLSLRRTRCPRRPRDLPFRHGTRTVVPTIAPVTYERSFEALEEGESETGAELMKTLHGISETTFKDTRHATRSVHAKSHGLLVGELRVLDHLPQIFAQGIFAKPSIFPVVMRISTIPGDILDDNISTPRGLAIKLVGVEGKRLQGSEGASTQDFVLVNAGPAFASPGAKQFLSALKLLATTVDKAPSLKKALSAVFRGFEKALEVVGAESGLLKGAGGHPVTNVLGETFYSQVPILFGPYMAKLQVAPVSPALKALTNAPVDLDGKPNGLRDAVNDFFDKNSAEWELRVQLCTDINTMPIEDASVVWSENQSPYIGVARISVAPQRAWSEARAALVDDGMSFSPWHGVVAHRPLGSVMRMRKAAYEMSAKFRAEHNGKPIIEPTNLDALRE